MASGSAPADVDRAIVELHAVKREVLEAADAILFAVETSLERLAAIRIGETDAVSDVERLLCAVLGACAFQDLTGQRLDKIEALLLGAPAVTGGGLMNGPALHGEGLDQAAADALFAEAAPPNP